MLLDGRLADVQLRDLLRRRGARRARELSLLASATTSMWALPEKQEAEAGPHDGLIVCNE